MSMRKIYRKIAKENGVTVAELKRDMQFAINAAYNNPVNDGITNAYQNKVPHKGKTPSIDEFISYAAEQTKRKIECFYEK